MTSPLLARAAPPVRLPALLAKGNPRFCAVPRRHLYNRRNLEPPPPCSRSPFPNPSGPRTASGFTALMASGSEFEPARVQLPPVAGSPSQWVNSLTVGAALAVAYVLGQAIYALTLHPLASIPGPKLCAVSRLPYWYYYFRGRDVHWLHQLHLRYGPELRFGPTDISYTAARAWQDIHGFPKGQTESVKAPEFSVQPVNGMSSALRSMCGDGVLRSSAFASAVDTATPQGYPAC